MDHKDILGFLGAVLNIVAYIPYYRGVFRDRVHPHLFSWIIWTLLTGIGWWAQVVGGAGPGAWVLGVSLVMCTGILILAFRYGEKAVTRSDWWALAAGLAAIPLWMATDDPTGSVILITGIDIIAFWPTFRKSWTKPHDEAVFMYALSAAKFVFALFALAQVSIVTALYPVSLVIMNALFVVAALARRKILKT